MPALTDAPISIPISIFVADRRFRLILADPKHRTPSPSDMYEDVVRMAKSIARGSNDPTCAPLNEPDLVQECLFKWTTLVTRKHLNRIPNRHEAFRFVKAVLRNHVRSLVGRHRLTARRGGRRMVEDEHGQSERVVDLTARVPVGRTTEVSMQDDDSAIQVADPTAGWATQENLVADVSPSLTAMERLVLNDFANPCPETLTFAQLDSYRGTLAEANSHIRIKIKEQHHAEGLGMPLEVLRQVLTTLRKKLMFFRSNMDATPPEIAWNAALTMLEQAFDIAVPRSIDKGVIRRLVTLAAIDQVAEVQRRPELAAAIRTVGGQVPNIVEGRVQCFGVLYSESARVCSSCSLRRSCATNTANIGLASLTIDARLLSHAVTRVPSINIAEPVEAPITNSRDEAIFAWLRSYMQPAPGSTAVEMRFISRQSRSIQVLVKTVPAFDIQLSNPPERIANELDRRGAGFWIPKDASADDAIQLLSAYSSSATAQPAAA